jgi:hypothetical protein
MTNQHPITPPAELVRQWDMEGHHQDYCTVTEYVTSKTAQWGADQELEACCEWVDWKWSGIKSRELRAARRPAPKPPETIEVNGFTYRLVQ